MIDRYEEAEPTWLDHLFDEPAEPKPPVWENLLVWLAIPAVTVVVYLWLLPLIFGFGLWWTR